MSTLFVEVAACQVPRSNICALGRASVQKDCLIPKSVQDKFPQEVALMERHGLLCQSVSGDSLTMTSSAAVTLTCLSSPVTVKKRPYTAFESRDELMRQGWELVELAYNCSASSKRVMKNQRKEYYWLFLDSFDKVVELAEAQCFSHAQKRGYYQALGVLCSMDEFETRVKDI